MIHALGFAVVAAVASAPAGGAQAVTVESAPVPTRHADANPLPQALTPPLDRDLYVTATDRRTLADGSVATFSIRHRLRFVQGDRGLVATLERVGIDCLAPADMCTRYRAALEPGIGTVRRFAVARDGAVALLAGRYEVAEGSHPGRPVDPAAVVRAVEREAPGALSVAEMRDAVRFVGMRLVPGEAIAVPDLPMAVAVDAIADGRVMLSGAEVVEPISGVTLRRRQRWTVDQASGLVMVSEVRTTRVNPTMAATDEPPVSELRWELSEGI